MKNNQENKISKLEKAKQHATSKGGRCLSNEYMNNKIKLEWKCQNNKHNSWLASYSNILNLGRWCPQCSQGNFNTATTKLLNGLKKAKIYAISKGGECLTNIRINGQDKLEWKCHNVEHNSWFALYNNVTNLGNWCPQCDNDKRNISNAIEKAKIHAISKHGKLLSTEYNHLTKMEWKCHNIQHNSWFALYTHVINNQSWCPQCDSDNRKLSNGLERAIEYAKNKLGKCLSVKYVNTRTKLEWKCKDINHSSWFANYNNVVNNDHWCPECAVSQAFPTIQEFKVQQILNYLFKTNFIKNRNLNWNINPKTNKKLELDGYCNDLKIAFEFQGRQHFEENIFKGLNLEELQYRDKCKKENCIKNGVKLIVVDELKGRKNCLKFFNSILDGIKNSGIDVPVYDYGEIEKLYKMKSEKNHYSQNLDF